MWRCSASAARRWWERKRGCRERRRARSGEREVQKRRAMAVAQSSTKLHSGRVADQIAEDLRAQILSGALADNAQIPSERELASHYDASGPTIREAVRVLTAMGLLSTRNGTRTTVTARGDALLAMSIATVVQFEKMSAADVFVVLEVLYTWAVKFAVERASGVDIAALQEAAERAGEHESPATDAIARLRRMAASVASSAGSRTPVPARITMAFHQLAGGAVVARRPSPQRKAPRALRYRRRGREATSVIPSSIVYAAGPDRRF